MYLNSTLPHKSHGKGAWSLYSLLPLNACQPLHAKPYLKKIMIKVFWTLVFLSFTPLLSLVECATNITVDDQSGGQVLGQAIHYLPYITDWSQGNNCSSCKLKVNAIDAFDGTWHDTTFFTNGDGRGLSFTFNGSVLFFRSSLR